jgi:uncharacterized protein YbaP (TraB family)
MNMMLRRHFNLALCSVALAPYAQASAKRGPMFWLATRGKSHVFLVSFAEAKAGDESWFTPAIRRAFHDSSELWLEVAPAEALAGRDAATKAKGDAEYQKLSHEPPGRTFFDELEPRARQRTLSYMAELEIKKETLEPLRPWAAYYAINAAYWSRTKLPYESVNVDHVLWKIAMDAGKSFGYEMPTGVAFAQFMAAMPEKAQSQYIEFLLNYFDDQKKGLGGDMFDWEVGSPKTSVRNLDRMRKELPDLYQSIQVQRNTWWAHKIDELLNTYKTCFIAMGHMHVLGPDGIPSQLHRLRVVGPSGLHENPAYPG